MKLLLTSARVKNTSTATYAMPNGADAAWRVISGHARTPLTE